MLLKWFSVNFDKRVNHAFLEYDRNIFPSHANSQHLEGFSNVSCVEMFCFINDKLREGGNSKDCHKYI